MGLFKKKSVEDKLREQKYKKFAEIESMFYDDPAQVATTQANWLSSRARHFLKQEDIQNAIKDLDEALRVDRDNLNTIVFYSAVLRAAEQTDEAEKIFVNVDDKKKIDDDPISLFHYYVEWGTVLWLNEKDTEALKKLTKAIKVSEAKAQIKKYIDFAKEAQGAGLDIDVKSFDIEEDVERAKKMITEIKNTHSSPEHTPLKAKKKPKTAMGKKEISVDGIADGFAGIFLENIDEYREELIKLIAENQKLVVSQDKARSILFYTFLTFWTLPLFNLFDKNLAREIFHKICLQVAKAYQTDGAELEKMTLDLRDYYNATVVENMQRMQGSAWFLDNLVKESNILSSVQIDAFMTHSLIFDWKKLSEEYKVV